MSAIPVTFRAFVAEQDGVTVARCVRPFARADLPPAEVQVRGLWSGVSQEDGRATIADDQVPQISPLIPGIDLAGEVVASSDPTIPDIAGHAPHVARRDPGRAGPRPLAGPDRRVGRAGWPTRRGRPAGSRRASASSGPSGRS